MNQETILSKIIAELKTTSGDEFFNTMTLQLNKVINADYTFIARLDRERHISKTISLVAKGNIAENFEYSLEDTPCADVSNDSTCIYPQGICSLYPQDQLLIDMNIEGYLGSPLHSSTGEVIGLVVALYETPVNNEELTKNLFELFSGRIAAEIERVENEHKLQQLNDTLEHQVEERTKELSNALSNLQATHQRMVEQERLASLGALVAGVAHEINTPLGVALLSSTNLIDIANNLQKKVDDETLSKNYLIQSVKDINESGDALTHNLRRAADLVANFKQVAVERNITDYMEVGINDWLNIQISSLTPLMKQHGIQIETQLPKQECSINTYPSKLSQVIVNLAQNIAIHAYPQEQNHENKLIRIAIEENDTDLTLSITDFGQGMDEETTAKIFDPFFTTKRNVGGTGLGLSIVHSIVTGTLEGQISVHAEINKGTQFTITLPKT